MSTLKSWVLLRSFCFVHNLAQSQPVYSSNYKPYYLVVYREYKGLSLFTGSNFKIKKVSNQARSSNSFDQNHLSFHQRPQSRTNSQQLSEWNISFVYQYIQTLLCLKVNSTARIWRQLKWLAVLTLVDYRTQAGYSSNNPHQTINNYLSVHPSTFVDIFEDE